MRTPEEAIAEILSALEPRSIAESVPLVRAFDRVLARDVVADVDLPPFEKSAMDGFAVRSADFRSAVTMRLRVIGESRAGAPFRDSVAAGECVEIYTGAEVPAACDSVVMVEKTQRAGADVLLDDHPTPGQHVCHRGEDLRDGDVVLTRGRRIAELELSVLAAVGADPVAVVRRPRVALCTTGDELVPVTAKPRAGEIREGNTFYLAARLATFGADVTNLGIVRDEERALEDLFRRALDESDALVTTGGVSMGKYDLVGGVLERIGVRPIFHKVAIKPGKPLWFGMHDAKPVFALPGNPVSCLVGMEVFVRPALAKLGGLPEEHWHPRLRRGRWAGAATRENPREQHLPVQLAAGDDGVEALTPIRWTSSADIVGLTRAEALAIVPGGQIVERGELVRYRPLR